MNIKTLTKLRTLIALMVLLGFTGKPAVLQAQSADSLPVTLDALFKLADDQSRALKISTLGERMAAEQVEVEKRKALPAIEVSASTSYLGDAWLSDRDFSNGMNAPMPHFGNNFALEASQLIYAGGAVKRAIGLARLDYALAQLDKERNQQDIRFLISGYYLELLKLNNQQQILEKNIAQTSRLLNQIRAKYQQGTSLKNNTTRYELQLQSLELALLTLENSKTVVNNELVKTLQLSPHTRLKLNDDFSTGALPAAPEAWLEMAQSSSPVLKQLRVQAERSAREEELAKAGKLPQVFAFAGDKLDGPIVIEVPPIDKNLNYWYAGLGIKYNISSLYKKDPHIRAARISTQRVLEQNEMTKDQLRQDIHTAQLRYLETLQVHKTRMKGLELARENYTIIKNRYLNDLVLITEMLDAENEMVNAELQAENARINILFHYYQLKKLAGTL